MSITIYLQFIGRVLRPAEGKKYGIIIDPVGNYFIHGRPEMERHWSLYGRAEQAVDPENIAPEMKICPQCGVMNAKVNILCYICGYNFIEDEMKSGRARKLPVMVDGKLVVLDDIELATRKEEIKQGLAEQKKQAENFQEPEETELKSISKQDKIKLLKDGLNGKKGLFSQAVKEWL
jgi:superfamily II DNA or RNA helicase